MVAPTGRIEPKMLESGHCILPRLQDGGGFFFFFIRPDQRPQFIVDGSGSCSGFDLFHSAEQAGSSPCHRRVSMADIVAEEEAATRHLLGDIFGPNNCSNKAKPMTR